jgi:uncharacterized protein (TIGR00255 family)
MALSSMTGFGRASGELSDRFAASIVIRSVNHRFLDVQVRTNLRDELPEIEAAVRGAIVGSLARGRVTVQIDLERTSTGHSTVVVDGAALEGVVEQLVQIELPDAVSGSISLGELLAVPGIVSVTGEHAVFDETETMALQEVARRAAAQLIEMRRAEGERLCEQLLADLGYVERFLEWFEPQVAVFRERILERLRDRLDHLVSRHGEFEAERVVQEAALVADRSDVSEEVVRLHSHIDSFRARLGEAGAVGRTLDFLCQEIHRELNTLGSKCREVGVGDQLVEAKAATERMREQVQNLE